jgi:hypothetical protein
MNTVSDVYQYSSRLEQSLTELYDRETAYQKACTDEAEAEHAYKMKNASEFLGAEGSVEARKATALVACDKLYLDYLRKAAVRDFTKEKLRDSQQALSARQSLLTASVKSELGYANDKRVT